MYAFVVLRWVPALPNFNVSGQEAAEQQQRRLCLTKRPHRLLRAREPSAVDVLDLVAPIAHDTLRVKSRGTCPHNDYVEAGRPRDHAHRKSA